jgi:hypothetical protein
MLRIWQSISIPSGSPVSLTLWESREKVNSRGKRHFLDSPYARLLALACFALAVGALAFVHRDDLFPAAPVAAAQKDDAFSRCFRNAAAPIDKMLAEKTIGAENARLFRMRAEARCRAQTGTLGGPPANRPPGLPPVR